MPLEAERLERHRVLVEERPAPVVDRVIDEAPEPEPEQDSALDPGVHAPARRLRRIGLGRAYLAHGKLIAKPHERASRRHRIGLLALCEQFVDAFGEFLDRHGYLSKPNSTSACRTFARLASEGGTIGRR